MSSRAPAGLRAAAPSTGGDAPRTVLLVTYYFPPSGGSGVQRMLKFTKYLPHFGWRPVVLTVREDAAYPVRDASLWADVPEGTRVIRTPITEFYGAYRALAGQAGGDARRAAAAGSQQRGARGAARGADDAAPIDLASRRMDVGGSRGGGGGGGGGGRMERLLRWVRAGLFVPDGRVGWIPHALGPGARAIREERASVLLSSGPPFTANVIGGLLNRRTGVPWVQDYRDPWTDATFYPDRPRLARALDRSIERWTVRRAARTIAVNEEILADLGRLVPSIDPARCFAVLPNGFDEEDFALVPRIEPEKLTLVHTGTLWKSRDPVILREALASLAREEPDIASTTEVLLAGRIDPEVLAAFAVPPLDRIVRPCGYLEHAASLRLLRSGHLCLLFVGEDREARGMLTGKVFEYLGSGTPILAIAPPEESAARLIRDCRAGFVVAPSDGAGIREILRSLWTRWRDGERHFADPDAERIAQYGRKRLTGRLSEILSEVVAEVVERGNRPG